MQEIVDRCHKAGQQPFLLPIIRKQNGKERNQYRHVQTLVNRNLKEVARMAGIGSNLTMYCARHSWATIARQLQIPMEVISSGMGHANERTTAVYLKAVDSASIDLANRQIISRITAP
jgi:integrase